MIGNLEGPISQVNMALCEKLTADEDRHENMLNYYQSSLERLLFIQQRMAMMSQ